MGSALRIEKHETGNRQLPQAALAGTVRVDDTVRMDRPNGQPAVYYLLWRTGPSYPWHSEEFTSRSQAHQRFFELVERGVEAYLEKRRPGRPE